MNFLRLELADLPDCASLFIRIFNAPPWNEKWRAETVAARMDDCFATPGFYGLKLENEGQIVGFTLGYTEHWGQARHFYLKEMGIAPECQGSGFGAALMAVLESNLKAKGVAKLYLHTARDGSAQAFYEKQGFYVSPKMIMMTKWLKSP